jgi:hypothetical protein
MELKVSVKLIQQKILYILMVCIEIQRSVKF